MVKHLWLQLDACTFILHFLKQSLHKTFAELKIFSLSCIQFKMISVLYAVAHIAVATQYDICNLNNSYFSISF